MRKPRHGVVRAMEADVAPTRSAYTVGSGPSFLRISPESVVPGLTMNGTL